jgi:hypothetical protein
LAIGVVGVGCGVWGVGRINKNNLLTPNSMLDKDKQKLFIASKDLRIFKLTFRNIYKFLRIN